MIYLLYGEDSFTSRFKLQAIKQKFLATHAPDNLTVKLGSELKPDALDEIFAVQTLLGGKRLVILQDVLSEAKLEVKEALHQLWQQPLDEELTVVVWESQKFDARQKLFKFLNRPKLAQEFSVLKGSALIGQLRQLANQSGLSISPVLLQDLVGRVGEDLHTLHHELDKLAAFADGQPVTVEHLNQLVVSQSSNNVFILIEKIMAGDTKSAHRVIAQSLDQGEDEIRLMGAIAYQLRQMIRVADLGKQGKNVNEIIKLTGLPPFVVRKNLNQIARFNRSQLVGVYTQLVKIDHSIKTGSSRPADALDLLVAKPI